MKTQVSAILIYTNMFYKVKAIFIAADAVIEDCFLFFNKI